jgi:uncharacterized protein YegP (UPF0339 family)
MKIEVVYANKQWFFAAVHNNGNISVQSEGYDNKSDALTEIQLLKTSLPMAPVVISEPPSHLHVAAGSGMVKESPKRKRKKKAD